MAREGFFARAKAAEGELSLKPATVLLAGTSGHDYLCYEILNEARVKTLSAFMQRAFAKATPIRDARVFAARDVLVRKAVALQPRKGRIGRNTDQNPTGLDFSDVLKWSGQKSFVERFTKAPKPYDDKIDELSDYVMVKGVTASSPADFILIHEKDGAHGGDGRNCGHVDCHVRWYTEFEFQRMLREQRQRMAERNK